VSIISLRDKSPSLAGPLPLGAFLPAVAAVVVLVAS